jgi:hypothetical protein
MLADLGSIFSCPLDSWKHYSNEYGGSLFETRTMTARFLQNLDYVKEITEELVSLSDGAVGMALTVSLWICRQT